MDGALGFVSPAGWTGFWAGPISKPTKILSGIENNRAPPKNVIFGFIGILSPRKKNLGRGAAGEAAIGDTCETRSPDEGQRTHAPSRRGPLLAVADEDGRKNATEGRTRPHIRFVFQNPSFSYESMLLLIGILRVLWDFVCLGF